MNNSIPKLLPYIPIAILPYPLVAVLITLFSGWLPDAPEGTVLLGALLVTLIVIYGISFLVSLIVSGYNLVSGRNPEAILRITMIIKLIHIPAYIAIFVVGLASLITIFTAGISIVLWLLDVFTIIISGTIGLSGIIRALREHRLTGKEALIHGLLQFVFCADVISSIIAYRTVARSGKA